MYMTIKTFHISSQLSMKGLEHSKYQNENRELYFYPLHFSESAKVYYAKVN